MWTRKLLVLAAFAAVAVLPAGTLAAGAREAESELASIGNSGITAEIEFVDTGSAVTVNGEAKGLDPTKPYVSLIYDNGSVATGPRACEPTIPPGRPGHLTEAQMFLGFWMPMGSSERTLHAVQRGPAYAAVGTFRTVSVRQVISFGPPPNAPVRACGVVVAENAD